MKFKRQRRFHAEVATASLNDIMFFLMLFFLIISTLGNPNVIKLLLPKSQKSDHDVSKQPISLSITADKRYYINSTQVPFDQLESRIISATQDMEEPTVVLRAESTLTVQDLVDVMALGAKLKVRMVLATELNK
ncbi:MAG: ExbD/TolR family protein [Spirosomataceae bacterium]